MYPSVSIWKLEIIVQTSYSCCENRASQDILQDLEKNLASLLALIIRYLRRHISHCVTFSSAFLPCLKWLSVSSTSSLWECRTAINFGLLYKNCSMLKFPVKAKQMAIKYLDNYKKNRIR